ncbi:4019_t:CDS:1, partial [Scutellospora calospora]
NNNLNKKSNPSSRPRAEIWNAYIVGEKKIDFYSAKCEHYSKSWQREIPNVMELHLANEYSNCPQDKQEY